MGGPAIYAPAMVQKRRVGAESSETRARIVEATEQVIRDEGYAAASSRRVALRAELPPSLVHYYFPTTDDLLLAVFRRGAEQSDAMIEAALTSADPVRALWRFFSDPSRNALAMEFVAMANHRKAIRAEIARHSEAMRDRQAQLMEQLLGDRLADHKVTAAGLSLLLAAVGRTLVMEADMGVASGHADARASVEALLDELLPPEK
ncbi:TetR family transcriptional regulator [Sphingobium yanoikuyae]|jgi:AcrR family transcriptional regulator|nr:TetR family transcriptional regulator [Sphingobium sp. IP1]ATI82119.1 TetR family transcriptional regulator [Sphingobium yanoikuyae]MBT2246663.1 TetR family transcriptional regulator [Sphingobium sp. BHU LFT2]RSU70067.1 TetR family transcriptional regulator [Sphingomonas sp. S-NIH.Pt3_0716]AYO79450.1 TetR family transcriptional regulator [Sphingobium yanoikuyae]KFD25809.1 TetR family transcriptional regulator [Sphingobium yanoikuyae]